jgi:peroxiredoxin Q/BCP
VSLVPNRKSAVFAVATVCSLLGLPARATAQQVAVGQPLPQKIDVARLGPQRGDLVPDFRLQDPQGKTWTRDSIMGPKGAMVVFSRSLDWCPYCKTQAIELQTRLGQLEAQGLGLAVITYDSPAVMADFARRRGITFPLLSDSGSQTIKAYGILNSTVATGTSNYGIPFPGTFLIDRGGRVTSRFFEEAYQERNTVSTIFLALGSGALPTTAKRVETDHLDITSYTSDAVVAPGSLFSLVFDITPTAGIHVYAPGAKDYRVITFRMDPSTLVTTRPLQYPASEIYHFQPLDERVPVFQKPFRLVQSVAVSASQEVRAALTGVETVTITGTLEYQACDDRVCFTPRSVPLSHVVRLRKLDTERATVPK